MGNGSVLVLSKYEIFLYVESIVREWIQICAVTATFITCHDSVLLSRSLETVKSC